MLELFCYGFFGTLAALGWAFLLISWHQDLSYRIWKRRYYRLEGGMSYPEASSRAQMNLAAQLLQGDALAVALLAEYNRQMSKSSPAARSYELLQEWLSPEQRLEFENHKYFYVIGSNTHRRYKITVGTVYNVIEHDHAGNPCGKMCFTPAHASGASQIVGDIMLAQKIMLETDEYEAHRIANKQGMQGMEGRFTGYGGGFTVTT